MYTYNQTRYEFKGSRLAYVVVSETNRPNIQTSARLVGRLSDNETPAPGMRLTGLQIQSAPDEKTIIGLHYTRLSPNSDEADRFVGVSRLTIEGRPSIPLLESRKPRYVSVFLQGMSKRATLVIRKTENESVQALIEDSATRKVLLRRVLAKDISPVQFDDIRRRTVVPSSDVTGYDC